MDIHFRCSHPGAVLFEYDYGIRVALPATVTLSREGVWTYRFEVIDDSHPVGDPLIYFFINAGSGTLECISVNWCSEYCGRTTSPGVVVNSATMTVDIYVPLDIEGSSADLQPVVSSNLAAAGWAPPSTLEVAFLSGSLYQYAGVPVSVFDALMKAPSKGKYFWANIRKAPYQYRKLR